MGKMKEEVRKLIDICEKKYEKGGSHAVIEYINEAKRQGKDLIMSAVSFEWCKACESHMPSIVNICLVCGQPTKPQMDKQQLVDDVIEDLKKGFAEGDYTVLDELLNKLPIKTLVRSLPEDDWDKYKDIDNSYFEIMHMDFNEDGGREEIQIHTGENGNMIIAKTPEGFVVDVYGQNDLVDTMAIWEDSLTDGDDDIDYGNPEAVEEFKKQFINTVYTTFTDAEIAEFKRYWGQSHSEITAALGYPKSHAASDELLMVDYFWIEEDKMWFPKCASTYSKRDEEIADYLRCRYYLRSL